MSGFGRSTPAPGNRTARPYVAPTAERRLEKKLAAVEKSSLVLTEKPVAGLTTRVNEKELGKGAMVIHMGQTDGNTIQLAIHRAIGSVPNALATTWNITPKSQISTLLGAKNPFEGKTQQRVSALKVEYGVSQKVLLKNPDGQITYPDGVIRDVALADARKFSELHASVEGSKTLKPAFLYGGPAVATAELRYLNTLAQSQELQAKIDSETAPYLSYETKDPVTGQTQVAMSWAEGLPPEQLPIVLMDVITTGSYNASKWDVLKEKPARKSTPFSVWGYVEGHVPPDKLARLKEMLLEYAKIRKDYNLSVPQGQKAELAETNDQKAKRLSLHVDLQMAVKRVNEAERFEVKPYVPYDGKSFKKKA